MNFIDTANQIAKLKAIIFNAPESEHAKIQLIKEELAKGRYQINSMHIAAKLQEYAPLTEKLETA